MTTGVQPKAVPLCVDLDGTLILTDSLFEATAALMRRNPFYVFSMLVWLLGGKANFKHQVAKRAGLGAETLPWNEPFVDYLRARSQAGVSLYLVSGADAVIVKAAFEYLGIFTDWMASDGVVNLVGARKREALDRRFGPHAYAYAGDSSDDMTVWTGAASAIVISASPRLATVLERAGVVVTERFLVKPSSVGVWLRAIRLHQWLKNLLLFVPVIVSHRLHPAETLHAAIGFAAFVMCASAIYLWNDLVDMQSDRRHPRKKNRPLASGLISIPAATIVILALLGGAAALCYLLPVEFGALLLSYFVLCLAYSHYLKRVVIVDVIMLAGFYTMRVFAGGAATGIVLSTWLLAFSTFFFFSLALVRRYCELLTMQKSGQSVAHGRGYLIDDLEMVPMFGTASSYVSVLVFALYVSSTDVRILYHRPGLLWMMCPILLFWITRVWLLAHRDQMHDDPVIFAAKDRVSYVSAAAAGAIIFFSK
jgi:4-hydroxybenzoate polyprenyltransferase